MEEETPKDTTEGYFFMQETHIDGAFPYCDSELSNKIRYYICAQQNKRGRTVLHLACENGDKHFVTMILYETYIIKREFTMHIVDMKDSAGLSPLYLLCEQGFRKNSFSNDDDWHVFNSLKSGDYDKKKLLEQLSQNKSEEFLEGINFDGLLTEIKPCTYSVFK